MSYEDLAQDLKCIVGQYRSLIVFLTHDDWICSIRIEDLIVGAKGYARHFFIPFQFHSTANDLRMLVTMRGSIVLMHRDEIIVIKNGIEIETETGFEKRINFKIAERRSKDDARMASSDHAGQFGLESHYLSRDTRAAVAMSNAELHPNLPTLVTNMVDETMPGSIAYHGNFTARNADEITLRTAGAFNHQEMLEDTSQHQDTIHSRQGLGDAEPALA